MSNDRAMEISKRRVERSLDLATIILEVFHINSIARNRHGGLLSECRNPICVNHLQEIANIRSENE